jgi:TolB-like protein
MARCSSSSRRTKTAVSPAPETTEVLAALDSILASPIFVRARRAQSLLRFVVQEALEGRADTLNGHAIATAVFGKGPNFDPSTDPLVRVEARRLRSKLCEYYATVGASDRVVIELRPGSYVPAFRVAAEASLPDVAAEPSPAKVRSGRARAPWGMALPAVALVALLGVGGAWQLTKLGSGGAEPTPAPAEAPRTALRVYVEPFDTGDDTELSHLAFGITEEITTRLGAYANLQVFVTQLGAAAADFRLSGSIRAQGDTIRVSTELAGAESGEVVWSGDFAETLAADSVWRVVDAVSSAVTATVGEPFGPAFDSEVARSAAEPNVDPYHCLLRFLFAMQVVSEPAHGRATECFEQVVAAEPRSSMSWARLAALYRMEYLHAFNVKVGESPPLERAANAVRQALDSDPNNPFAHQEMAFLCQLLDDRAGFEEAVARTLALHPSADIRAALGINFVKMGEVKRGLELIDRSMAESPRAPPFFFIGYVVHALRLHDYNAAYKFAQRMATRDWPLSQAILAASAALAGRPEQARKAAQRLLELEPEFAATGREFIARGRVGADVEQQLASGLLLAGVELQ